MDYEKPLTYAELLLEDRVKMAVGEAATVKIHRHWAEKIILRLFKKVCDLFQRDFEIEVRDFKR